MSPSAPRLPVRQPFGLVYVVDADPEFRQRVRWLFEGEQYRVLCFDSGEEFIARYDAAAPGILLLEQRLNGMSGLEVQEHLLTLQADVPIAFLVAEPALHDAVTALKRGAVDYLEKPLGDEGIRRLVDEMLREALKRRKRGERRAHSRERLSRLTPREKQVLQRVAAGRLNKQISDDLGISIKTVEAHRSSLMDKTEASTVAELMRLMYDAELED